MNRTDIVIKTPEGAQELKSRAHKLVPRLRTMLIMIDGAMNVGQLQDAAARLGAPPDFLESLLSEGLAATRAGPSSSRAAQPASATAASPAAAAAGAAAPRAEPDVDRFRTAQKFMNDAAVEALGFRAFLFTLKLEKCFSRTDLLALMDEFHKAIVKGSGEETARVIDARARELIG